MAPFFVFEKGVGGPEKIPAECEDEKFENVLGAPENKNREKRVWAIAQNYLHSITFKIQCPRFLSTKKGRRSVLSTNWCPTFNLVSSTPGPATPPPHPTPSPP